MTEVEQLRDVLRRFRTVVGLVAAEADLEPRDCVVTVKAVGPSAARPLAKVSLADCFAEIDGLLGAA